MKYTVKNFKIFNEQGVTFDIAPITMLTGCNSSGKSSLVKSMMVLGEYLAKVKSYLNTVSRDNQLAALQQPVDFASGDKNTGGFSNIINNQNTNGLICFQYSVRSKWLLEDVTVTLKFEQVPDDSLGRMGRLHEATFQLADGTVFYQTGHFQDKGMFHKTVNLAAIHEQFRKMTIAASIKNLEDDIRLLNDYFERPDFYVDDTMERYQSQKRLWASKTKKLEILRHNLQLQEEEVSVVPDDYLKVYKSLFDENVLRDDIIALQNYQTVFYQPWLKLLDGVSKKDTRAKFEEVLKKAQLSESARTNLDFILNDFEKSNYDDFLHYYLSYEKKALIKTYTENDNDKIGDLHSFLIWNHSLSSISVKERAHIDQINSTRGFHIIYPSNEFFSDKSSLSFITIYFILWKLYFYIDSKDSALRYQRVQLVTDDKDVIDEFGSGITEYIRNNIYLSFQNYINAIWEELLVDAVPSHFSNMVYLGSARALAQRWYSFDKPESELNSLVEDYVKLKRECKYQCDKLKVELIKQKRQELGDQANLKEIDEQSIVEKMSIYEREAEEMFHFTNFIDKWLVKFGLCDSVQIDTITTNNVTLGCSINFVKNEKAYSVADEGYGCIQLFSILVAVQNAMYRYAISLMTNGIDNTIPFVIIIEEPENHLHPKLQSLLADMFLDAHNDLNFQFIIETHSEYLIRKSQVLVKKWYEENKDTNKPCPFQAYYIPVNGAPYSLGYRKDGKFSESFGPGFYDESANLTFEIM